MNRSRVAVILVLATAGCAQPSQYRAPVETFRDASAVVIRSTQTFLQAMNKTERDHYIADQVASQSPIQLSRIEEVQVFGPEAIAARVDALDRLTDYTNLLYQLATADSPGRASAQARDLGVALNKLSTSAAALTGADNDGFKRTVTTVLPVLGDVLQTVVQRDVEHALQKAIAAGAAPVNSLIEAIKVDAEVAFQRKRNALSKRRADAAVAYNAQVGRGDGAALRRLGDAIAAAEDQWAAFQTARPAVGLEAMQQANLALETFARTRHPGAKDMSSFVDAMEVFAAAAARLGEDVARLRDLGKDAAR